MSKFMRALANLATTALVVVGGYKLAVAALVACPIPALVGLVTVSAVAMVKMANS